MGLFGNLFGSKARTDAARMLTSVPLDALEEVKDRILSDCARRADWSQHARILIADRAKEVFYLILAARDLLRANRLERSDLDNIAILVEKATAAEEQLAAQLDPLGPDARDLRRELAKAFAPCREAIVQLLPRQDG
ncbi:MAG TPA: hypothetical protein VMU22_11895 [Rhizomicrobium sp.]|nr:hypothetical protein [Rhizomicrobium sp.]